jgi:hypothetical protein
VGNIYTAWDLSLHPDYEWEEDKAPIFDLAIVAFDRKITLGYKAKPICLPYYNEDFTGKMVTLAGWASNGIGNLPLHAVHEHQVKLLPGDECKTKLAKFFKFHPSSMLCTDRKVHDPCNVS